MGYKSRNKVSRKAVKMMARSVDKEAREGYKLPLWRRILSRWFPELATKHWARWEKTHLDALRKTSKRTGKLLRNVSQ
jgi:hypothetical protein